MLENVINYDCSNSRTIGSDKEKFKDARMESLGARVCCWCAREGSGGWSFWWYDLVCGLFGWGRDSQGGREGEWEWDGVIEALTKYKESRIHYDDNIEKTIPKTFMAINKTIIKISQTSSQ